MQTQKVQITLTPQETTALMLKAKTLGYNVAKYIKFLVSREAFSIIENIPVYPMNENLERKTLKALGDYKRGKLKNLQTLDELEKL